MLAPSHIVFGAVVALLFLIFWVATAPGGEARRIRQWRTYLFAAGVFVISASAASTVAYARRSKSNLSQTQIEVAYMKRFGAIASGGLFVVAGAAAGMRLRRSKLKAWHPPRCGGCGYELEGLLEDHCPECNRDITTDRFNCYS